MNRRVLVLPVVLLLGGCGGAENHTPQLSLDTTEVSSPGAAADSPSSATLTVRPDSTVPFQQRLFRDYAAQGVAIPRSVTDSIAGLNDPVKMKEAMDRYMHRHDSLVRRRIADHYGITLDSLKAIIRMNRPDDPAPHSQ